MPLSSKGEQAISDLFHMVDVNRSGVLEKSEYEKAKKSQHEIAEADVAALALKLERAQAR